MDSTLRTGSAKEIIEGLQLQLQKLSVGSYVPEQVRSSLELQHRYDSALRAMVLQLTAEVTRPARRDLHTTYIEQPATWWEHLKRDHAPKWFLKRYPVRTVQIPFEYEKHILMCPHADFSWPRKHLEFLNYYKPLPEGPPDANECGGLCEGFCALCQKQPQDDGGAL